MRLLRGNGVFALETWKNALGYIKNPNIFCFQTYFKMNASATVGLKREKGLLNASLDARPLFEEAHKCKEFHRKRINEVYKYIENTKPPHLEYTFCVPGILQDPSEHMRLVRK